MFRVRFSQALVALACASAWLACTRPSFGQAAANAALVGTVRDASGARIPDAVITVTNAQTRLTQTATTDAEGFFRFPLLPIGTFEFEVTKEGFRRHVQKDLVLNVGDYRTINVTLEVGTTTSSVVVEASAPLLETETGTLRGVIDQKRVLELPLQGRDMLALLTLQAGVIAQGEGQYSVSGSRGNGVFYTMDSGYNTDSYRNFAGSFPNPDAVQEFSMQNANFSAEYGNATGAVVSVVTKSGTNEFRGTLFNFMRNYALNARNFFAARRDSLKRNQFGGTIGGPVQKDRLFFFASYQGTRQRSDPGLTNLFLPTAAMRNGDFSAVNRTIVDPLTRRPFPNNQIPVSRFSKVTSAWLPYFPVPSSPDGRLQTGLPSRPRLDEYLGRLDYYRGAHRFTARYFRTEEADAEAFNPENMALSPRRRTYNPYNQATFNHVATLTPNLIHSATVAYRWISSLSDPRPFRFPMDWARAGIPNFAFHPPEYNFTISGYFSAASGHYFNKVDSDLHLVEGITWIRNRHEIKAGGDILRSRNKIRNHFQTMGVFTFNGNITGDAMADFLLGEVYRFVQGGGEFKDLYGTRWGFYFQDNFRARNDLTLNLGLRWDPVFPYQDKLGRVVCFRPGQQSQRFPNAPDGNLFAGDPGCPGGGFESQPAIFSPRFGFAWRPGSTRWVFRGGFGLFYAPEMTVALNRFVNVAPWSPTVTLNGVKADNPYAGTVNPFPESFAPFIPPRNAQFLKPVGGVVSFTPDFQPTYTQTYNLTVEREVVRNLVARASYVGNLGRHLTYNQDINYARYIPGQSTTANIQQRRPYAHYANLLVLPSDSTSSYHALQLSMERRFGGLSVSSNFTWSKSIDDFSIDYGPGDGPSLTNPTNRKANRGLSDFDRRYRFVTSAVWTLPRLQGSHAAMRRLLGNWQLSGIFTRTSGSPFSVLSGADRALSGIANNYADLVGDPYLDTGRSRGDLIARYFNPLAFRANAEGTFGTAPRNLLRGPGSAGFDTALMRNFNLSERLRMQLRGEAFGVLNRPNLGNPVATVNTGARFGSIQTASGARILQLALKVSF